MEKVNDRARVANERHRENSGDEDKERHLDHKVPAGFVLEVFATDIEERCGRTASRSAVIPIRREGLKIPIGNGKPAKIPASPTVVSFGDRFHRLLAFLL
jgi:hypothetical protein